MRFCVFLLNMFVQVHICIQFELFLTNETKIAIEYAKILKPAYVI